MKWRDTLEFIALGAMVLVGLLAIAAAIAVPR